MVIGPSQAYKVIEILKDVFKGEVSRSYALRVIRDSRIPVTDADILRSSSFQDAVSKVISRVESSTISKEQKGKMKSYLTRFARDVQDL